jgi:hypothetical protein
MRPLPSEYSIPDEILNPEPEYYKAEMQITLNPFVAKCLTQAGVVKRLFHLDVKWKIRDATSSVGRSVLPVRPCNL